MLGVTPRYKPRKIPSWLAISRNAFTVPPISGRRSDRFAASTNNERLEIRKPKCANVRPAYLEIESWSRLKGEAAWLIPDLPRNRPTLGPGKTFAQYRHVSQRGISTYRMRRSGKGFRRVGHYEARRRETRGVGFTVNLEDPPLKLRVMCIV